MKKSFEKKIAEIESKIISIRARKLPEGESLINNLNFLIIAYKKLIEIDGK